MDIGRLRGSDTFVYRFFGDGVFGAVGDGEPARIERGGGCKAGLKNVETAPHVAFAQGDEGIDRVGGDDDAFGGDDVVDSFPQGSGREGREAETGTAGEKGRVEFVGVICNDAEAGVGGIFLHDSAEGVLCRGCHCVGFVKNDEFEVCECRGGGGGGRGGYDGVEDLLCGCKRLDLFADHVDTTIIGGVEFKHLLPVPRWPVDFPCKGKYGGGFPCARRAVEEEMG